MAAYKEKNESFLNHQLYQQLSKMVILAPIKLHIIHFIRNI